MPRPRKPDSPFRYFNSSPEVIRLVVLMYVRFPLSLRNVEDLLFERGIDICHETVRMRSAVTSRSNCANERSMLRVSRPMLVVVLNDWVIETNEAFALSNRSTSFEKSRSDRVSRSTL